MKLELVEALSRFIHLDKMPKDLRDASRSYLMVSLSRTLAFALVQTYLVLYFLEFLSYAEIGVLVAVKFVVQTILDYPTGSLGDRIGQDRVLKLAYGFYVVYAIWLLVSDTFWMFLVAMVLYAIGSSQESGALDSWYDNLYEPYLADFDPERKIFGAFQARQSTVNIAVFGIAIVLGGILSYLISRWAILAISAALILFTLAIIFLVIPRVENGEIQEPYLKVLRSGLVFLISDRSILLFYLGEGVVFGAITSIWVEMILYPYYFGYATNDFYTGVLRASNFVIGMFLMLLAGKLSAKIINEKRIYFISMLFSSSGLMFLAYLYYLLLPPTGTFVLLAFIGVVLVFQSMGLADNLSDVLMGRIQLKIVPNKIRNSVYSLLPTITTLIGIPFSLLGGYVITTYSFEAGILLTNLFTLMGAILIGLGLWKMKL